VVLRCTGTLNPGSSPK